MNSVKKFLFFLCFISLIYFNFTFGMQYKNLKDIPDETIDIIFKHIDDISTIYSLACSNRQCNKILTKCHISADFSSIENLNDEQLINFIKRFPNLESICFPIDTITIALPKLKSNIYITDKSIYALAEYCHFLKKIWISNNKYITDKSLIKLTQECPSLEDVKISFCPQLTTNFIDALNNNCFLKNFQFYGDNDTITEEYIKTLHSRRGIIKIAYQGLQGIERSYYRNIKGQLFEAPTYDIDIFCRILKRTSQQPLDPLCI